MANFQPSKYQEAIFAWIDRELAQKRHKPANLVVEANPGSGKTTTLVQAANRLPVGVRDKAIFVAFNKHIATELQQKLPQGMQAKTLHGVGYSAIVKHLKTQRGAFNPPRDWVNGSLNKKMAQDWLMENKDRLQLDSDSWKAVADSISKLVDVCQLTLTDWRDHDAIWDVINHYGLDELQEVELAISALPDIFRRIVDECHKHISFGSMVWLPVYLDMKLWQFDVVMADEAQDFNAVQRKLVQKLCRPSGFTVWVGDPHQAIYGFAFASTSSISEIIEETNADILPLSICYRCPSSHVALAGSVWPEANLEPRHGAPEGEIHDVYDFMIPETIRPGDLVVSRVNAPLIPLCFRLIRDGIGARVKGRDIGANLKSLLGKIEKSTPGKSVNWEDPYEDFANFKKGEATKILRACKGDEDAADMALSNLGDKLDTLLAIWEGSGEPRSTAEVERQIDRLFADEGAAVWLSTIHKAKGLEADNVYIVMPSKLPHPMAKKAWEKVQEENMRFIAYSRAKQNLYFAWNQDEPGCPAIALPEDMEPEQGDLLALAEEAAQAA